ncbi:putative cnl2 nkp2 family protein [Rosellinia necatrix]|uniref:Putative cnl2 nkp2 family protein n=1 Tax=Rosellinia necatrix TaxID=77044 RepID=A0A1W2TRB8_ROSNE|nr:putative cnl2 nkp2 family protein [Rosellinia necatrix]
MTMAPTEATILRTYLLLPSRLPSIISLQEFTALFPKSQQSSPYVRTLYRDLQQQRNAVVDGVSASIDAEVKQAKALRRTIIRTKKESELEDQDDEIEIERALFGHTSTTVPPKQHSLQSIIPDLDHAIADVESDLRKLEEEEVALLESIKQAAGNMSDLRYGRLSNANLTSEVIEGLHSFQETCRQKP